jgi:hypothetical protein
MIGMASPDFWWVQPIVTGAAIVVAVAAIWWNRRVTRLKATLDLIEAAESKEYYQERYRAFREYRKSGPYRSDTIDPGGDREKQKERDKCIDFLNHYELVAIASERGIIDENFYRLWMGPTFVRDWNCATDLVRSDRTPRMPGDAGGTFAYSEFERLAVKWGGTKTQ